MKGLRSMVWTVGLLSLLAAMLLIPSVAGAQQPTPLLPGQAPEVARPLPYWLSYPVLAGAAGLALVLGFAYWRLSSRFYGREEPPPPRQRPRFAGMAAVQPVAAAPQGAASARPGAAAAAQADAPAASPPVAPDAQAQTTETAEPAAPTEPTEPETDTTAPKPAPEEPAPEPAPEKAVAASSAAPASGGHVEPDQETFDRVLREQIDKGVDRRVAEGRARAAAVRAAREKAGAG